MDFSGSPLHLQDNADFLLDCQSLLELSGVGSDSGYYSAGSSLSPTSSVASCCLSPLAAHCGTFQETSEHLPFFRQPVTEDRQPAAMQKPRKPRSKYPGKKRQTASEREKLRMRDLTKALQHLRTYLPASVAPVGQTLTKIETLRLTIRYISHLSDQLGLSETGLSSRTSTNQLQSSNPQPAAPDCFSSPMMSQTTPYPDSFSMEQFPSAYQNPGSISFATCFWSTQHHQHQHQCSFYGQG
ncbi:mesoderm posterior aa [Denticeps clupeoides]|uniref:mesoderm posterior aa n=1 Tax=Denticeps clupeoides TaxID=299321 RepID=UPI0010A2D693|nr:mesoderm posterior protein 2-like [Denticeps clupeoides]